MKQLFRADASDSGYDMPTLPPQQIPNVAGPIALGSIGNVLTAIGRTRSFALATNPVNGIQMITTDFPLRTIYPDVARLVDACSVAVAGESRRAQNQALMPAAGADLTLALNPANVPCFGIKLTIANPFQSYAYGGRVFVTLQDGAAALYQVGIDVNQLPGSVVLLGVRNAGGQVTVVRVANPTVVVNGSANALPSATETQNTLIRIESLNARDIGALVVNGN